MPREFHLHDRAGEPRVTYGGDAVHFDPGSSGVHVLDPETLEHRPSTTADLVRLVKVAEMLPELDAQSTAIVCDEIPKEIGDLWRLFVVLMHSTRPIVTGAFSVDDAPAHDRHARDLRRRARSAGGASRRPCSTSAPRRRSSGARSARGT